MKLLVITPIVSDTFSAMTERALSGRITMQSRVDFKSIGAGPRSIEGFADEVMAGPEVLKMIKEREQDYDGFFINCFGDVAVDAAREITQKPVLGAGECAYYLAAMTGVPFSIVTIGSNARNKNGLRFKELGCSRFVSTAGIEESVLSLNDCVETTAAHIAAAARREMEERGAEAIVLGCTGMIEAADLVRKELGCPVIEPSSAGIKMLEAFVELGISHPQGGRYTPCSPDWLN